MLHSFILVAFFVSSPFPVLPSRTCLVLATPKHQVLAATCAKCKASEQPRPLPLGFAFTYVNLAGG